MKKLLIFILFCNIAYSQINIERTGNVIYSSYTHNTEASSIERDIAKCINKFIRRKCPDNFPVVVLNIHYEKVINLKSNTRYENIEMAYQTSENQFLGGNGNIVSYDGEHIYIDISLDTQHKKYIKKLIIYARDNLKDLMKMEHELRLRSKKYGLSDEEKEFFTYSKRFLDKN